MPPGHLQKITVLLALKKLRRSGVGTLFFGVLPGLFLYLSIQDSFETAMKFFLFLFPHVFLFLSAKGMKDDIENGPLENVLFSEERFKDYLIYKSRASGFIGLVYVSAIFGLISILGITTRHFVWLYLPQFIIGCLAGIYYLYLGSFLSFSMKAGSHVLVLILAQVLIFVGILMTVAQRGSFLDYVEKGRFPDFISQLKFLAVVALFPNVIMIRKIWFYSLEIAFLLALVFIIQNQLIRRVEIRKS